MPFFVFGLSLNHPHICSVEWLKRKI